jgi:hypothetical protein
MMKTLFFHGKPLEDAASQVCVLYDPKDGAVFHVHGATAIRSDRACSKTQLEERAIENAKAFGHPVERLKALHVPIAAVRQRGTLRLEGGALVPLSTIPASMKQLMASHRKGGNRR